MDLTRFSISPLVTVLLAHQGPGGVKFEPLSGLGDFIRLPAFDKAGIGAFYANNN